MWLKIVIPLTAIRLIFFLTYLHEGLNQFAYFVIIVNIFVFLLMSYLSFRLKIVVDYMKREIYIYSFRTHSIKFNELFSYSFSENSTIDGNYLVKLKIRTTNQKEIKVTLSFSAATKKGFAHKKDLIIK